MKAQSRLICIYPIVKNANYFFKYFSDIFISSFCDSVQICILSLNWVVYFLMFSFRVLCIFSTLICCQLDSCQNFLTLCNLLLQSINIFLFSKEPFKVPEVLLVDDCPSKVPVQQVFAWPFNLPCTLCLFFWYFRVSALRLKSLIHLALICVQDERTGYHSSTSIE